MYVRQQPTDGEHQTQGVPGVRPQYCSEPWTTHIRQGNSMENFHLRCLRRILPGNTGQDKITNTKVLGPQAPSACTVCYFSSICVVLNMRAAWMMDYASSKTFCTVNWQRDTVQQVGQCCDSRITANGT